MPSSTTSSKFRFFSFFLQASKDPSVGQTTSPNPSLHRERTTSGSSSTSLKQRVQTLRKRRFSSFSKAPELSLPSETTAPSQDYHPYTVFHHHQSMRSISLLLKSPETLQKVLQAILNGDTGRKTLGRLARTCRAFAEPVLDVLWKDLDSLIPVLGLFPKHLLKKAKKPGLGLVSRGFKVPGRITHHLSTDQDARG